MRKLREHCSIQEAERLALLFRSQGIVTFMSNTQTNVTGRLASGTHSVSLWVVLQSQYDDAFALLDNENHNVTSSLSVGEMEKLERQIIDKIRESFVVYLLCSPRPMHELLRPTKIDLKNVYEFAYQDNGETKFGAFIMPQSALRKAHFCDYEVSLDTLNQKLGTPVFLDVNRTAYINLSKNIC